MCMGWMPCKNHKFFSQFIIFSLVFSQLSPCWGRIVDPNLGLFVALRVRQSRLLADVHKWLCDAKNRSRLCSFYHFPPHFCHFLSIFSLLRTHRWPAPGSFCGTKSIEAYCRLLFSVVMQCKKQKSFAFILSFCPSFLSFSLNFLLTEDASLTRTWVF